MLPIGVVPLTAVITRLRFGPAERATVNFLDGTTKKIPIKEIGLYVGEKENPDNQKQVASLEVELPALQPFAPLQFVDTPGLGSAFMHNTEAAITGCRTSARRLSLSVPTRRCPNATWRCWMNCAGTRRKSSCC